MPKHNDESIYGLDRNVTFKDRLFGSDGDNNKKSANYAVGDIAQLILNTFGEAYSNTLLSGGVTWISGFTYEVSDLAYILNSIFYTADSVQITLDDANATNDRIDVIVVNANGDISVITGTPSVNPVKPQVPDGFLEISFVIVEANATQPETIVETLAYNENLGTPTEWAPSQLNTTAFNFASTTNPFRDSNSILFTNVIGETNRELSLTSATNLLTEDYSTLHFYIKLNAPLVDTDVIQIYLKNASNETTNYIRLGNGSYGFDINNTSSYQSIIIPFSAFVVKPEQFNSLNIVLADDVTSSFQIDYIRFIGGINASQTFNTLLSLLDTPNTYTKKGGYGVIVNDAENSVVFKRVPLFEDLYSSNAIINGGIIYETGLTYTVWATAYIVNGIVYFDEPISEQVTLNPADATNARIDVFAIFNDGEGNRGATVIEGIPDPNPIKPNLTNLNQVEVSFKLLQANETAPPEVNSVAIYDENAGEPSEWTNSVIPTGANPNFATDPFTGSVSYDLGLSTSNRDIEFTSATAITYNANGNLVIGIKSLNRWSNLDRIDLRIGNNNDRIKSNYVTILRRNAANYNLDLDSSDWQYAYIPLSAFAFQGQTFDVIEGQFYLNTQVYLDNIFVQTGNINPITTPANTNWGDIQGNLQNQADLIAYITSAISGYLEAANNLSDLSDVAAARTNLGFIDDDTFASATASNFPSAESVKSYVDANSGGASEYIFPTDYTGTDTEKIQQAVVDGAAQNKPVKINKKDGVNTPWDIEEAILLYSNNTIIIDAAILKLTDTSRDNIFRTSNCGLGITSPYTVLENIHIKGINGATLSGADNPRATGDMFKELTTTSNNTGNFSYGTDAGVGGEHQFGNWQNISVLFAFTKNYSVKGLKIEKSHSWSISNERCSFGKFLDLEFNVVSERNIPNVGIRYVLNGDGINFRMGCRDMIVDNVKGYTHDDTIACTVLNGTSGEGLVTEGEVTGNVYRGDVDAGYNISINNIKTTTLANNIRLLNSTNTKVYNIFIDNVVNTNTVNRDNRSVILIGSTTYGDASNLGEMFNVFINNIKNVFMSHCISIDGSLSESSISNVIDESNQNQDDPVYVDPLGKGVRDVMLSNVFKDSITTQLSGILNGVPPFNAPVSKSLVLEEAITVPISQDETTPLVVGTNITNYRLPYNFSIKEVRAYLNQAASGSPVIVDINKTGLGSLMSSNIRIEDGDKSSKSSPTPPFLTTISLEDDDELTFDIDAVDSGGTASGLKAMLIGYKVKREVLDPNAFIFTTRPTNTFTIPTKAGETYNYNITTSDGQSFKNVTGNQTINFLNTGVHTISITGTFPVIYFNFGAQRSLMGNIVQWGNPNWGSDFSFAFYGCTFLTCTATDNPFFNVVTANTMFRQCSSFSLTNNMDFTNVTNGNTMFRQSGVRNYLNHEFAALQQAPNFGRQVTGTVLAPNLNFAGLLGGNFPNGCADAFVDVPLSTEDYSNILIRAAANNPNNNVRFDGFDLCTYNASAVTARNQLISRGWTLADAGQV